MNEITVVVSPIVVPAITVVMTPIVVPAITVDVAPISGPATIVPTIITNIEPDPASVPEGTLVILYL